MTNTRLGTYALLATTPIASAEIHFGEGVTVIGDPTASAGFSIIGGGHSFDLVASHLDAFWPGGYDTWNGGWTRQYNQLISANIEGSANVLFNARLAEGQDVDAHSFDTNDLKLFKMRTTWSTWYNPSNNPSWGGGTFTSRSGSFLPGTGSGYLGLQLTGTSGTMYGWLKIDTTGYVLNIQQWAFDDSGAILKAGEIPAPGALGLLGLALGAAGIRRKRAN